MADYSKSEAKDWARTHFRGLENILLPAVKKVNEGDGETMTLDEAGIRHDVRMCKENGFFMTTASMEGMPFTILEYVLEEFWQIVVDEAAGEILIDAYVSGNTLDDAVKTAKLAEACGCDGMMFTFSPYFRPGTEDDIYEYARTICDSVDLAVTAYATHKYNFERFHSSTFNPHLLERIAEIDNVVAMKMGVIDTTHITHCFELFGDRCLIGVPSIGFWSTYIKRFGMQWAGSAPYEHLQTPEKPYLVELFGLLLDGRFEEAMDIFWKIYPAVQVYNSFISPTVQMGNYNYMQWKYWSWLNGFNGGPITLPTARLYEHDKETMKRSIRGIGLEPREPDEEFYVGRVNHTGN